MMNSIYKCKSLYLAGFAAAQLYACAALADGWPPSVIGNWSVEANNALGQLLITSQGPVGQCRPIAGTIFGNPIQGFYCPGSGRISFLRKIASTNDTFQVYSGNLSQQLFATPLRIGGSFSSFGAFFGEYNFRAIK
jgi:hypothetical protein